MGCNTGVELTWLVRCQRSARLHFFSRVNIRLVDCSILTFARIFGSIESSIHFLDSLLIQLKWFDITRLSQLGQKEEETVCLEMMHMYRVMRRSNETEKDSGGWSSARYLRLTPDSLLIDAFRA